MKKINITKQTIHIIYTQPLFNMAQPNRLDNKQDEKVHEDKLGSANKKRTELNQRLMIQKDI